MPPNGEVPYGYIADPDDHNHLIPDPETAHVVKQIFAMYVRGDRICEIQNWLRDNKNAYTCGNYRNRARNDFVCTTHYIRKPVLKELVLADLQRFMSYVRERE